MTKVTVRWDYKSAASEIRKFQVLRGNCTVLQIKSVELVKSAWRARRSRAVALAHGEVVAAFRAEATTVGYAQAFLRETQQDIYAYILRHIQKIIRYFLVEQADIGIFNGMIVIAQAAVTAASQGRSERTSYEDVVRGGEGDELVCQGVRAIQAVVFADTEDRWRQITGD